MVLAPAVVSVGTVQDSNVVLGATFVALTPSMVTVIGLAPEPKPLPLMVIDVPAVPEVGDTDEKVGAL